MPCPVQPARWGSAVVAHCVRLPGTMSIHVHVGHARCTGQHTRQLSYGGRRQHTRKVSQARCATVAGPLLLDNILHPVQPNICHILINAKREAVTW